MILVVGGCEIGGDEQKKGTGEYDGVCPDYLSYIFIPAERKRRGLLTGFQLTG